MTEVDTSKYVVESRKICWPNPDATCLHGGCTWCEFGRWKTLDQIERYARGAGTLPHRGMGEEDALHAFEYGREHTFFDNVPLRTSRAALEVWVDGINVQGLKALADGMKGLHDARKSKVMAWMLRYRRDVLEESYRRSTPPGAVVVP